MTTESTLQEILKLLGHQSDNRIKNLLESIVDEIRKEKPVLDKQVDIHSLLKFNKGLLSPDVLDLKELRKLLQRIEAKIEGLLDEIACLLKKLRKAGKNLVDALDKKRLLKLIVKLINLFNLKNIIERIIDLIEKGK